MTEYRFTFELNNRRGHGESPGLSVPDPTARRSGTITLGAVTPNTILAPTILEYCFEKIQRAELIFRASTDAGTVGARATTWRGLGGWYIDLAGVVAPNNYYDNGGDATILELPVFGDRKDVLQFGGDALAALSDLSGPATIDFNVEVSRTNYFAAPGAAQQTSSIVFDDFADDALDTLPSVASVCLRRLKTIQGQGGGLLVLAETINQKITVPDCCAALGFQQPIVLAADLGNGFGQISLVSGNWTAAMFRPHPRVFIRPSNTNGWAIKHLGPSTVNNPVAITADEANLYPLLASRRPTHSAWRIGLDGNILDVIVAHPPLPSDLRRPRDIWRGVWAPAIEANTPILTYGYYFVGIAPNFGRTFYSRGVLTGLNYLDFAYCLDLFDSDGGDPLVEFPEI